MHLSFAFSSLIVSFSHDPHCVRMYLLGAHPIVFSTLFFELKLTLPQLVPFATARKRPAIAAHFMRQAFPDW
jgi:hypothetical protein